MTSALNSIMILYRPVGLLELELIYESGMTAFPPRLPEQPIFYPVLNLEYARQIASEWNTKREPYSGYVTEFKVDDDYASQFEPHIVGGSQHQELWIPAERLNEFNQHIVGEIRVIEAHFGDEYQGFIPEKFGMKGKMPFPNLSRSPTHTITVAWIFTLRSRQTTKRFS